MRKYEYSLGVANSSEPPLAGMGTPHGRSGANQKSEILLQGAWTKLQ